MTIMREKLSQSSTSTFYFRARMIPLFSRLVSIEKLEKFVSVTGREGSEGDDAGVTIGRYSPRMNQTFRREETETPTSERLSGTFFRGLIERIS